LDQSTLQASHTRPDESAVWPDRIHAVLKRNSISQVGYVPDNGHARLIALCQKDNEITDVVMTTEAEGPGLVLGATLGGKRAALLMQSSGVGNSVNTFSILKSCGIACLLIVTMRGEFDDFNPWQVTMGAMTEATLKACGFLTYRVERAEDVEDIVSAGCNMAYGSNLQIAILLAQRLIKRSKGAY
jgi:sulfopyruvate decarboxylase TPP-binding subunit